MSQRFYTSSDLRPGVVTLQGSEAHHLAHVCRFRPGDQLVLFNGNNREYVARVVRIDRRAVELEVVSERCPPSESRYPLHIAAALPKGERADWMIEKLTELGVTTFTPLQTHRSIAIASSAKLERMRRLVIEASKQCGRNVLMEIREPKAWQDFCVAATAEGQRWMAQPGGSPLSVDQQPGPTTVAIGPEGGWAEEEVELARAAGWRCLDLGPRTLRVETAAMVCAALFSLGIARAGHH